MRLLLLCSLICVPSLLFGQSDALAGFRHELKRSGHGMFVLLEDDSSPKSAEFRKILQEEELAELRLALRIVKSEGRDSGLADYLRSRFSWGQGAQWAFVSPDEHCLIQGVNGLLPDVQTLATQLARMGIESPVRRLRAFLRQYPDSIDGRTALLRALRSIAEERTRGVLRAEPAEDTEAVSPPYGGTRRSSRLLRQANAVKSSEAPVRLSPEDDLRIWVRWSVEFDRLVSGGQWLESDFTFEQGDSFLDAHSSIVRDIYKKNIGAVEDALGRWPGSVRIWGIWIHMSLVLGDRPISKLVTQLTPMPDAIPGTWPPFEAKLIMIEEARRSGNWRDLRDLLMDSWQQVSQTLSLAQQRNSGNLNTNARGGRRGQGFIPRLLEAQWQQLIEPLIESLLMLGDIASADNIVNQLRNSSNWEELSENVTEIARRCQMPQIAVRWKR